MAFFSFGCAASTFFACFVGFTAVTIQISTWGTNKGLFYLNTHLGTEIVCMNTVIMNRCASVFSSYVKLFNVT